MHNKDSVYVCATGKAEDYTVIDLFIEDPQTGKLHNLHASAQLFDKVFENGQWSKPMFWSQKDWGGFWVPYAGSRDTEKGKRPKFLKGSDREIQILKKKFSGYTWNMMIGIGGIYQDGNNGGSAFYPAKAIDTDKSTWMKFSFKN